MFISCDSANENDVVNVNFSTVAKGELNGNGAENIPQQQIIITSSSSWNELLSKMNMISDETSDFIETEFDFSKVTLIAVFDEIRNSGGHSIDIIQIIQKEEEISVEVKKLRKGDDSQVITQPYHIIKISKNDAPVSFK